MIKTTYSVYQTKLILIPDKIEGTLKRFFFVKFKIVNQKNYFK